MSNKNLDGKYGIRYGIFAPPLAEQVKEQGYRFPDKKTEDKFENANKAISTIHMAELITDEEWEKILDKFHNDLIRVVVEMKKEKKYRPFKNTEELFKLLYKDIGHSLIVRKSDSKKEYRLIIGGYSENELLFASFGVCSMHTLFNNFELCIKGIWTPFGVAE